MERQESTPDEEVHKEYWRGLFAGFVAQANRDNILPMQYLYIVREMSILHHQSWKHWNLSLFISPKLSYKETGLPEILSLQIYMNDERVAHGAARAEWVSGKPQVTQFEYIPNDAAGIDESMIGKIANYVGAYLERPDDYKDP